MVLYRKYRPQKLSDIDSKIIRERLHSILSSDYIPHAFLLTGPKGTGKTSTARILAKVFNCEKNDFSHESSRIPTTKDEKPRPKADQPLAEKTNIEPCDTCANCVAIRQGTFLDVLEVDAASNRGIDEIRELRENIKLAPLSGRKKVYIIDEVHMLTTEAFNALLKTLEEPPAHAVFILATTEADKLPATVVSRAAVLRFAKAGEAEITHALTRVLTGEKKTVEPAVIARIAKAADGSFRDAAKILEQVLAEENSANVDMVLADYGKRTTPFLMHLSGKKTKEALSIIETAAAEGIDFRSFTADILSMLHAILLRQAGLPKEDSADEAVAKVLTKTDTLALLKLFTRVYGEIRIASSPNIPIEVAVVEWCEK